MSFAIGSLVTARGRDWVVLPDSEPDLLVVRPLGGTDEEVTGIHLGLEQVRPAALAAPTAADLGDYRSARLLRDAVRLGFRASAGPFRSFGRLACEPRPYQLVPLLLALRLDPVRLLIADDVGIGKTVEACLIARELLDRGEVQRLAVLCPPHLAEQWQSELASKFSIDAELVLPSTARRLEASCRLDQSVFDVYPFVIVSTDYIKADRRRADFLRSCPELVIVDEAHTCAASAEQRGTRHQRHALLKGLAENANRHLILVTATPHSGNEDAFRSLLVLLDPSFASLPTDLDGPKNEPHRRRLAAHVVQRRRGDDIAHYLNTDTPFPEREEKEDTYTLHPEYRALLQRAIRYARTLVRDPEGGEVRQRVRWWSALALLRSLASSPAAAAATLRSRAAGLDATSVEDIDQVARQTILDAIDEEPTEGGDVAPGGDSERAESDSTADSKGRRELLAMAKEADGLVGEKDHKLQKAIAIVKALVRDGFHPIVFCRFIPTAEYVAASLRDALPKGVEIAAVTGVLPPADRETRVHELAKADRRVLICTDCLSEGINLQGSFNAVVHYDLSWNPTRHEQREGRVDRYGQASPTVRVVTYYGVDNQIDGLVLDVLLKKHKKIRGALGISVPVPVNTEHVMAALVHGALLRGDGAQLALDFRAPERDALEGEWVRAAEREKRSRTLFAQHTIDPTEVAAELASVQRAIGSGADVEQFMREVLTGHGAQIDEAKVRNGPLFMHVGETPTALRDAMGEAGDADPLRVRFSLPVAEGVLHLHRTHSVVQGVAGYVMDSALDPHLAERAVARRSGVVRTRAVCARTTVMLLRLRYGLIEADRRTAAHELLVEDWQLLALRGTAASAEWLSPAEAETLVQAIPDANIAPDVARTHVDRVIGDLAAFEPHLNRIATERATAIRDAHRGVRKAAKLGLGRLQVVPKLPVDVLGLYLYLPA
jgi:superfamily II DNA or RNA helicase